MAGCATAARPGRSTAISTRARARTDWLAKGVIKQHRTIATYFALLRRTGFAVTHIDEWGPSSEQVAAQPELAAERERPPFLLVACRRA